MSKYELPGFVSMRGFGIPGVPNGFCGGFSVLGVNTHRPSVFEAGYSLTQGGALHLYRLFRAKSYHDPYQGTRLICDLNGAMNIYGAYAGLSLIASGAHTLVDYSHFTLDGYHEAMKGILTRHTGVITEWARGLALPGDESDLHFHFTGIGGIDDAGPGYAMCDDDWNGNAYPAQKNPPPWRTWATLQQAQPIAYIVCAH